MFKSFGLYLIFSVWFSSSIAQNNTPIIVNDNMVWLGYFSMIKFNERWSLNSDVQFRTRNEIKNNSQALLRTGVSYKLNEKVDVTLGMAHFRFFITNDKTRGEWRPWQEVKVLDQIGKVKLSHRFRVEQRFNELVKNREAVNEYQFNLRFRYRFDLRFPLIKEKEKGNNLYGIFGNELMINAGNTIVYNYFDQNRLYTGINYEINKKIALQLQYMHLWQQASDGLSLNSNNIVRFNIYHTISI
jgi:hypothetical protein